MPEGPEVETVRRTLSPLLVGQKIGQAWVSELALRTAVTEHDFKSLKGHCIHNVGRHGKLLWIDAEKGQGFFVRLGMTGRLLFSQAGDALALHTHVRLPLGAHHELRYVDPRRFGLVVPFSNETQKAAEIAKIGPDPLLWTTQQQSDVGKKLLTKNRDIKALLLDQALLAGVGNIYASEALFMAKISPFAIGSHLTSKQMGKLLVAVEKVLQLAVDNCGTTFSNYVDGTGKAGNNLGYVKVFQREHEPCKVCDTPVIRAVQAGRSTFYCAVCQSS